VNGLIQRLREELQVSASTQNQALAALLFLHREVLARDLELEGVVRARTRGRLAVVLTPEELRRLHRADVAAGWGRAWLLHALAGK
jgi:hypothetical protein